MTVKWVKSGKNCTSVNVFLVFLQIEATVNDCILSLSNIKTPSPSPSPSSSWYNHYLEFVCGQLLSPHGMKDEEVENGQKTSQEAHGIPLWFTAASVFHTPFRLPHHPPFFYISFLSLFHPLGSWIYPLKQMLLIPVALHYKIFPIPREHEGGGKNWKEEGGSLILLTYRSIHV